MPAFTKTTLLKQLDFVVIRTERGKTIVQRDPRDLPRRIRLLLLSIDGSQPVKLYMQKLQGFGDVADLLAELLTLGLVALRPPELVKAAKSESFTALEGLLDDSRFNSQNAADVLYGSTTPGSFDDMLRVARAESPEIRLPPAPAPAPVSSAMQQAQIDSLFHLLDAVRGERQALKARLEKMQRLRGALANEQKRNERLKGYVYALSSLALILALAVAYLALRR